MKTLNILFFGSAPESNLVFNQLKSTYPNTYKYKGHTLKRCDPCIDLIVVASYGQIIPQKILDLPKYGALNIHPSLLPKYRGATPIPSAILAKESTTGVTIIKMIQKVDAGPILSQETVKISPTDTSKSLLETCFNLGAKMLIDLIPEYIEHKITPISQPQNSPTPYTKKFKKLDGFIPWDKFIELSKNNFKPIDRKIRALYPWPGVWTTMPNGKTLKILPQNLFQLEGKSPISWKQLSNGYQHLLK